MVELRKASKSSCRRNPSEECQAAPSERKIKVYFTSGDEADLRARPGETVSALCRRTAELKDAGWATLIADEPLEETLLLSNIPEGQHLLAVLHDDFERPDRLSKRAREQIRVSLGMHGVDLDLLDNAFLQEDWKSFRDEIDGIQDFHITVFKFARKRFVHFDYGMGDNGFGSIHAINAVDAIMDYDDGTWIPLVKPWTEVCQRRRFEQQEEDDDTDAEEPEDEGDEDSDSDDGDLPPFFRSFVKASSTKRYIISKGGCEWD